MSKAARNKAAAPTFDVASLFLIVGICAVCFAVAQVVWPLGVVMIAAAVPAMIAVVLTCFTRRSRQPVGPLALFFIVAGVTFVLILWWGALGWTIGLVADLLGGRANSSAGLIGACCGLTVGVLCGIVAAADLVIFAPENPLWSGTDGNQP